MRRLSPPRGAGWEPGNVFSELRRFDPSNDFDYFVRERATTCGEADNTVSLLTYLINTEVLFV